LQKPRSKPQILNSKEEAILAAVSELPYVTALDIAYLFFSPTSLTHVREVLNRMAGGNADYVDRQFLYRFPLPSTAQGTKTRVYSLGAKGREILAEKSYYRPYKLRNLSHSHIFHHLTVNRFVCAAHYWCRGREDVRLSQTRLSFELSRTLAIEAASKNDKSATFPVADAWLEFEILQGGLHKHYIPIWLEVETGSKGSSIRFKQDLLNRIEYIERGGYSELFKTDAVVFAYLVTGEHASYLESRRKAISRWIQELLSDLKKEKWANIFRITSVVYGSLLSTPLFDEPIWHMPHSPTPISLFTP
jgi:hypothetical protein